MKKNPFGKRREKKNLFIRMLWIKTDFGKRREKNSFIRMLWKKPILVNAVKKKLVHRNAVKKKIHFDKRREENLIPVYH